jgi:DNA-directed RNA polymerase specialized sigma24 family protein
MKNHLARGRNHTLGRSGFENLLRCLDQDREQAGVKYEEMRRQLMEFFTWKRCIPEEDLADQTLDRVARRLESAPVQNLSAFVRGVAKMIVLEVCRRPRPVGLESLRPGDYLVTAHAEIFIIEREEKRRRAECLRKSILDLSPADRELFLGYRYCSQGRANKVQLARRFGFTEKGLRTRAHRVRRKVEMNVLRYEGAFNLASNEIC